MKRDVESEPDNGMLPEYDFRGGVRGKHFQAYQQGHVVEVHKADGTTETHRFTVEEGAILLEPDVQKYFPDSESVNNALRKLIELIPQRQDAVAEG